MEPNIKPKKNNLPLILTLAFLLIIIIVLIIVIIVINLQSVNNSGNDTSDLTSLEAEIEETINDATEPSKETTSLDCTREMTATELATFEAVSGQVEIVADFEADDSLGRISIYKTIIGPSTDAENPDAPGDEFLVENSTATAKELTASTLPTYYLNENTTKSAAKTSWQTQGFTCLDQSEE